MALKFPDKDPDEMLDYTVDWSRYLGDLTIASVVWKIQKADGTASTFPVGYSFENDALVASSEETIGLTANAQANTSTTASIVLEKGDPNTTYKLICEITTSTSARTSAPIVTNRKIVIKVRERV
jgi:hypothetical protein